MGPTEFTMFNLFTSVFIVILGIVKEDPKLTDKIVMAPPPQRTTQSVFDQEKAKVLYFLQRDDSELVNWKYCMQYILYFKIIKLNSAKMCILYL